ncbi:COP9 signalosome complex subunit 7b-like [Chanos chanos]|uniref:COP9 signalosome complex subunit 7b-like n=1 Tax=Chanos chanos TaxID=29144 RepID=A0A6J2VDM2_CHACN|nr:COP9 signalosome complex subunit 7b-like [Chanos chanos]
MAGELKHSQGISLEHFILQVSNSSGEVLIALINQLLEAPGIYVFGDFLELPCVQEMAKGPNAGYTELLKMFAYGTYHDYKAHRSTLPPLSEAQRNKLRLLTIVSLAGKMQCISYSVLQSALELRSLRQLEDLLIDALSADVIRGKLDQFHQQLEVDAFIGRDVRRQSIGNLVDTLTQWCSSCESVLSALDLQVAKVSEERQRHRKTEHLLSAEVENIYKMVTASPSTSSTFVEQAGEQERSQRQS